MAMSKRERTLAAVVLGAAGVFALDRAVVTPYVERRQKAAEDLEVKGRGLAEVRQVLRREHRLRKVLVGIAAAKADPSAVEERVLHQLHAWQREAGVGNASFQRVRAVEAYGFTRITFQASAGGSMAAVAALLHRVETSPVPLRVDQLQLVGGKDAGGDVQLQFTVSTLCRKDGGPAQQPVAPPTVREPAGARGVAALGDGGRP
jgi:hypothetical protein